MISKSRNLYYVICTASVAAFTFSMMVALGLLLKVEYGVYVVALLLISSLSSVLSYARLNASKEVQQE